MLIEIKKGIGVSFSAKGIKLREKQVFKSLPKSLKKVINPANQMICRVYPFIPVSIL